MIVGPHNWLVDLDESTETSLPTTAAGYEAASLWSGGTAKAWRSASASVFPFRFHVDTDRPVGLAAVFGLQASGGATITSVTVRTDTVWPTVTGTILGSITLNERGDGALVVPIPITAESWSIWVQLDTPALLTVGGLWLGEGRVLPAPTRITRTRQSNRIRNVSEGMTHRSTRIASPTRALSIEWPSLEDADAAAVMGAFDDIAEGEGQCVLIPDEDDTSELYYGAPADLISATIDAGTRLNEGLVLDFEEDGRALGV